MAIYSITNTFTANTLIQSAQVNANFTEVSTAINTTLCGGGNAVVATRGGTGQTSFTTGDILYASSSSAISKLAIGSSTQVLTVSGGLPTWGTAATANQSYLIQNAGIAATVGTNLLTVRLYQADGATAPTSGTGAVLIGFRSATASAGGYDIVSVTSPTATDTVAVGATLGNKSGVDDYIYVYAVNVGGTVELALAGSCDFDEGALHNTTAMGAGSTSRNVLYSYTARSGRAIRLVGRLKSNQTLAGTYTNAITEVYPGFKITQRDSAVMYDTSNGYGSTNTKIKRYTNTTNIGRGATTFTVADSSTNGGSITVNEPGLYNIQVEMSCATTDGIGVSKNVSANTAALSLAIADCLVRSYTVSASGTMTVGSGTWRLKAGDVLRVHSQNNTAAGDAGLERIIVTKIGE